jgi:hypothetical protein
VEAGNYKIEVLQQNSPENAGGVMAAFTEYDTIQGFLSTGNSTLLNGTLRLPEGEQILTVQLVETGRSGKALDWLNLLVVHRFPGENDNVLRNAGITVSSLSGSGNETTSSLQNETLYFMRETEDVTRKVKAGEKFRIIPFADNPELIEKMDYFIDFEKVKTIQSEFFNFDYQFEKPGKYTLNAEFTDKNGIKNSARVQLEVL